MARTELHPGNKNQRRIFIRVDVLDIAPETVLEETENGIRLVNELMQKADQVYTLAAWAKPTANAGEEIRKEAHDLIENAIIAVEERRLDFDLRVAQGTAVILADTNGKTFVHRVDTGPLGSNNTRRPAKA